MKENYDFIHGVIFGIFFVSIPIGYVVFKIKENFVKSKKTK